MLLSPLWAVSSVLTGRRLENLQLGQECANGRHSYTGNLAAINSNGRACWNMAGAHKSGRRRASRASLATDMSEIIVIVKQTSTLLNVSYRDDTYNGVELKNPGLKKEETEDITHL